jgi:photosystem I reaction center subunit XII
MYILNQESSYTKERLPMPLTEAQILIGLFTALFPGMLAYKLCVELYRA